MTDTVSTNGAELAAGVLQMIEDLTVKPTRFQPNIRNGHVMFNHRQKLIRITVELKGNFVMEFDVDTREFKQDPERAFADVRQVVDRAYWVAHENRHNERQTLAAVMQGMN